MDQSQKPGLKHASKIVPSIALLFPEQITFKVTAEQRKRTKYPDKTDDEWILLNTKKEEWKKSH